MVSGEDEAGRERASDAESVATDTDASNLDVLRERVATLETDLERKTVAREDLEADLRRYVRRRQRRGHARGWGPYLVLLYGTAATVGAFYFLSGGWAILAMIVLWLSTLGLYVVFVLAGVGVSILERLGRIPGRLRRR
jgi:cytochrome c-type biogenesis protein CcmH/NrfG